MCEKESHNASMLRQTTMNIQQCENGWGGGMLDHTDHCFTHRPLAVFAIDQAPPLFCTCAAGNPDAADTSEESQDHRYSLPPGPLEHVEQENRFARLYIICT